MNSNQKYFDKITFLLPLKEREYISERIVKHLKNCEYKVNLIVADGSRKSQEEIFTCLKQKHNLIFKKYPFDKNIALFAKKFYLSSKIIKTKYCALIESDELINFEDYLKLINFMENNNNYGFVTGKIINFNITKFNSIEIFKKQCHPNFGELKKKNFTIYFYPSCWEGIHKTKNLKDSFKNIFETTDTNLDLLSLNKLFNIYTLAQADAKFLQDKTISFRQANTHLYDQEENISSNSILRRQSRIKTLLFFRSFKYYLNMYFVLKKYLRKENFKSEFIKYYSSYILNCLTKDITIFFKKIFYLITNKILKDNIEFFDDKKYFILQNIIVCGLDSLSNYEKEKLNKYIDNFKIKV